MFNLKDAKSIYFVGIGGISMSALAKLLKSQNKMVCGCDDNLSDITKNLEENGIPVFKSFCKEAIKNCDLAIYTNAISENNENLKLAKKLHKPILERATLLGEICKNYKNVIAVCGTHGKTTTTSMIAHILKNQNPTVHIGGITNDFGSNILIGNNDYFITEACEYNKSFLHINPTHLVVTNIEKDHMDCYKNFDELKQVFHNFICKTSKKVVFNDKFLHFYHNFFANEKILTFGFNDNSTYFAKNIKEENGCQFFDLYNGKNFVTNIKLNVVGVHNVENALAASALCLELKIPATQIRQELESFKNVRRRFEILYNKDITIISDYAHHPTEIQATINSAKSLKHKRIICVFEPHTYSRTLTLFNEFLCCFDDADEVFILKTYAAREKEMKGGTGYDLFCGLKTKKINTHYFDNKDKLFKNLQKTTKKQDLVLFVGAGTIDSFAREYVEKIQNQTNFLAK